MRRSLYIHAILLLAGLTGVAAWAQGTKPAPSKGASGSASAAELVERLLAARREYQVSLEQLRAHYKSTGEIEQQHRAEEELRNYHRYARWHYELGLTVPPPTLKALYNIREANDLYREGMIYKDRGTSSWSNDSGDNFRRAELLFQQLITSYPESNKIGDTAFRLAEIYESKAYRQYRHAALYYERCFQWNPTTSFDARLRAARMYDKVLMERGRAAELYKEVVDHETDPKRIQEARARLEQLRLGK